MLVFLSWDWSFCHGFISLSLCIVCVCVASCHLCLPEFHAFLGLCPSPSILLLIHPIIYQIIYPLAVLTYLSHLSLSVFISHLCPSVRSSISIWLFWWKHRHFFVAFYQEDHRNQGHKNQKVKMTRTQSFFFLSPSNERGYIQNWPDYLFYDVYQEFLSILHFGEYCFKKYFARNQSPGDRLNKSYIIAFE